VLKTHKLMTAALLASILLAGCGGGGDTTAQDQPQPTATEFVVEQEDALTFQIIADESEARFLIDEVLLGQDNTVVGVNHGISGAFAVNFEQPGSLVVGTIEVDASSFVTDDDRRNGAIRRFILEAGQQGNETVTFDVDEVSGAPETAEIGMTYPVTVSGQLTVHGITQPVEFTGEVTIVSEDRIEGSLTTTVQHADYDMTIPSVSFVAEVSETVILEFDFVAVAE
jgi:polyisoprenoid-binding protein YceI